MVDLLVSVLLLSPAFSRPYTRSDTARRLVCPTLQRVQRAAVCPSSTLLTVSSSNAATGDCSVFL